jgi:hypothetical protein
MNPGFLALYKRGNYVRRDLNRWTSEERERKREERERFAMAAISFCLKYDREFRAHFLEVVCRRKTGLRSVEIEQKPWGDVVLKLIDAIYVIEGKIKAQLQGKQNPEKERDFWKNGYGAAIEREYGERKEQLYYILLGYPKPLRNMPKGRRIGCRQVFWYQLEKNYPEKPSSKLALDLADCLAELGADAFYLRLTKKMKVTKPDEAAMAFEVLRGSLEELEIKEKYAKIAGYRTKDAREFGAELFLSARASKKRSPLSRLKNLVRPRKREAIGWFGYASDEAGKWRRSVWFYCRNKTARDRVRRVLRRSKKWRDLYHEIPSEDPEYEDRYVCIIEADNKKAHAIRDQEWFVGVFRRMGFNEK